MMIVNGERRESGRRKRQTRMELNRTNNDALVALKFSTADGHRGAVYLLGGYGRMWVLTDDGQADDQQARHRPAPPSTRLLRGQHHRAPTMPQRPNTDDGGLGQRRGSGGGADAAPSAYRASSVSGSGSTPDDARSRSTGYTPDHRDTPQQ
ncbi:hypothetical protein QAD02_017208 [Eretmocerus hayati]|uniref:Uncharacterized protein n=1 Tax=Eretmocerus hayati TaxID=131215 RepID=A0ACC2PEI3_9HYME|nr:hypothetical protein QAD02_017208 [Eretmocerus hayati]